MKVIPEKSIDLLYLEELEDIAKFHKDTIDEALKQCIACYHKEIKKIHRQGGIMDWCIVYDKDHYALLVYAYTKDIYQGEAVIKIPLQKIKEKIIELGISNDI